MCWQAPNISLLLSSTIITSSQPLHTWLSTKSAITCVMADVRFGDPKLEKTTFFDFVSNEVYIWSNVFPHYFSLCLLKKSTLQYTHVFIGECCFRFFKKFCTTTMYDKKMTADPMIDFVVAHPSLVCPANQIINQNWLLIIDVDSKSECGQCKGFWSYKTRHAIRNYHVASPYQLLLSNLLKGHFVMFYVRIWP